jgi:hypothetical protein
MLFYLQLINSLKRLELKLRDGRVGESSQIGAIRLIDNRYSYATRSATVADRSISNVLLLLGRELDIVQP